MSSELQKMVLSRFLSFYEKDIEAEIIDADNVVLSFPVHFSGYHRVEVTVTRLTPDRFVISDGAKVLEELRKAGYAATSKLNSRLETISKAAGIRVVHEHLVSESSLSDLGSQVQRFIEAAKSIGDAYLVQRSAPQRSLEIFNLVSAFLQSKQVPYQRKHTLRGKLENHVIDFYFPPNGVPGLALSVMSNPSRMAAEAWAFKSFDIRQVNERTQVGVVYDSTEASPSSKSILSEIADVSVPSSDIGNLQAGLESIGILKPA
ncbi:MAG: hypothetical protein JST28_18145 [Acidobacteria bacterium]|nr:hypothetical protein [Acidobacteriota bacterium]